MNRTVAITVDPGTGNMTYAPSVLHADRGDKVSWSSSDIFTLVFAERTPFKGGKNEIHSKPNSGKRVQEAAATIDAQARSASYRYQVAVASGNQVFLDPGCGEVIIG